MGLIRDRYYDPFLGVYVHHFFTFVKAVYKPCKEFASKNLHRYKNIKGIKSKKGMAYSSLLSLNCEAMGASFDRGLSGYTQCAIKSYAKSGGILLFNSTKDYHISAGYANKFKTKTAISCCNGAYVAVTDEKGRQHTLVNKKLSPTVVKAISDVLASNPQLNDKYYLEIQGLTDGAIANYNSEGKLLKKAKGIFKLNTKEKAVSTAMDNAYCLRLVPKQPVKQLFSPNNEDTFWVRERNKQSDKYNNDLGELLNLIANAPMPNRANYESAIDISFDEHGITISPKGTSKLQATHKVAEYYGIDKAGILVQANDAGDLCKPLDFMQARNYLSSANNQYNNIMENLAVVDNYFMENSKNVALSALTYLSPAGYSLVKGINQQFADNNKAQFRAELEIKVRESSTKALSIFSDAISEPNEVINSLGNSTVAEDVAKVLTARQQIKEAEEIYKNTIKQIKESAKVCQPQAPKTAEVEFNTLNGEAFVSKLLNVVQHCPQYNTVPNNTNANSNMSYTLD